MTHITHRGRFAHAAFALVLVMSLATPGGAQCRQFLYWSKGPVYADNVPTCFSRVLAAMTHAGFSGIKQNALEVAGSKGGAYASVTCIGTTPRATAVVMVVSGNESESISVRDDLFIKVTKTQGF